MNRSYECRDCQAQFCSPKRDTCVLCDSRRLDEISPLALPWKVTEESKPPGENMSKVI